MNYHVEVSGRGEPLVLLHGFTGSSQNWTPLVSALQHQFQLITIDLLGHGQTDAPENPQRYAMPQAAADLIAVCDSLELTSFNLLGYSMGGRLALYVAVHYPSYIKRLLLESASPGLKTVAEQAVRKQADDALAEQIEQNGIAWFVEYWENIALFATQKQLPQVQQEQQRQRRLQNVTQGLANSLRGMGTGVQPSLWADLDKLTMPVLLLTGMLDAKFTSLAAEMSMLMPHVETLTIADAGHTVHLEKPDLFVKHVSAFLTP